MNARAVTFVVAALVVFSIVRVASTARVLSATLDESAHVAAGYDWLSGVPYTLDATHPPLARVLRAIPARFDHVQRSDSSSFVDRGKI